MTEANKETAIAWPEATYQTKSQPVSVIPLDLPDNITITVLDNKICDPKAHPIGHATGECFLVKHAGSAGNKEIMRVYNKERFEAGFEPLPIPAESVVSNKTRLEEWHQGRRVGERVGAMNARDLARAEFEAGASILTALSANYDNIVSAQLRDPGTPEDPYFAGMRAGKELAIALIRDTINKSAADVSAEYVLALLKKEGPPTQTPAQPAKQDIRVPVAQKYVAKPAQDEAEYNRAIKDAIATVSQRQVLSSGHPETVRTLGGAIIRDLEDKLVSAAQPAAVAPGSLDNDLVNTALVGELSALISWAGYHPQVGSTSYGAIVRHITKRIRAIQEAK